MTQNKEQQRWNGEQLPARPNASQRVFVPLTDVIETSSGYRLIADMPGVEDKTLDVTLENDVLTLRGRVEPAADRAGAVQQREYEIGDYRRVFTLGADIDRSRIQATLKNGVLDLTLPKSEAAKPRRIPVSAA